MEKQTPIERLSSSHFCESGVRLLTNRVFSILAIISGAVDRRTSNIPSAEEV